MITTLLLPALLLTSGPAAVSEASPTLLVRAADGYAELAAEYEAALTKWREAIDSTEDRSERNELRRNHPAKAFYDRFEALSKGGDGQALFWMATHLKEKGLRSSQRGPIATELFGKLFETHLEAEWFGDVIGAMMRSKVSEEDRMRLLTHAAENGKAGTTLAPAKFALGTMLMDGDDEQKAKGEALLQEVAEKYAKTSWGTMARAMFVKPEDIQPGKPAPDFYGETIDGFGFNLSDYKGKVVLLDFYGFW